MLVLIFVIFICQSVTLAQDNVCSETTGDLTPICSSCSDGVLCQNGDIVGVTQCNEGNACLDGLCTSEALLEFGNCGCESDDSLENLLYADPYNNTLYVDCTSGVPVHQSCGSGEFFFNEPGICIETPVCESFGNFPLYCNQYYECTDSLPSDGVIMECVEDGAIFDYSTQMCQPTVLDCTELGEFSSPLKCNLYYFCYDSAMEPTFRCCPPGQVYDPSSPTGCVSEDVSETCGRSSLNDCIEEDYENTYCGYCQSMNPGDRYSTYLGNRYPTVCTRSYYQCEEVDGMMVANLTQCAEGQIFYHVSGLCETQAVHSCGIIN